MGKCNSSPAHFGDAYGVAVFNKGEDMIEFEYNGFIGTTCGQRKDGSRAVLWSDNQVEWFSADDFENIIHLSTPSILANTEV